MLLEVCFDVENPRVVSPLLRLHPRQLLSVDFVAIPVQSRDFGESVAALNAVIKPALHPASRVIMQQLQEAESSCSSNNGRSLQSILLRQEAKNPNKHSQEDCTTATPKCSDQLESDLCLSCKSFAGSAKIYEQRSGRLLAGLSATTKRGVFIIILTL